jgi:hypothetical protein
MPASLKKSPDLAIKNSTKSYYCSHDCAATKFPHNCRANIHDQHFLGGVGSPFKFTILSTSICSAQYFSRAAESSGRMQSLPRNSITYLGRKNIAISCLTQTTCARHFERRRQKKGSLCRSPVQKRKARSQGIKIWSHVSGANVRVAQHFRTCPLVFCGSSATADGF